MYLLPCILPSHCRNILEKIGTEPRAPTACISCRWYVAATAAISFKRKSGPTHACSMSVSLAVFIAQPLPQFFRKNRARSAHVYCLYSLPLVCCSRCHNYFSKKLGPTRACQMNVPLAVAISQTLPDFIFANLGPSCVCPLLVFLAVVISLPLPHFFNKNLG